MLQSQQITNPNPRKQYGFTMQQHNKNDYILIGLDANESMSETNSEIKKWH
jgi:hypothetical protein